MKYAVFKSNGDLIDTELTAAKAAKEILTHDGQDYEIRPSADSPGFDLWSRQQVANVKWHKTSLFSLELDEKKAETAIFEKVVALSGNWRGQPFAMTMESYNQMQADAANS